LIGSSAIDEVVLVESSAEDVFDTEFVGRSSWVVSGACTIGVLCGAAAVALITIADGSVGVAITVCGVSATGGSYLQDVSTRPPRIRQCRLTVHQAQHHSPSKQNQARASEAV